MKTQRLHQTASHSSQKKDVQRIKLDEDERRWGDRGRELVGKAQGDVDKHGQGSPWYFKFNADHLQVPISYCNQALKHGLTRSIICPYHSI